MDNSIRTLNIAQEFVINAPMAKVFEGLTGDVSSWWSHSFESAPKAIQMEAKLGGRFYEEWENGGGAIYAMVTQIRPGSQIKLTGPMGMSGPVVGTIEFELEERGSATLVKLHHRAVGEISNETMGNYSKGWSELLGKNLKLFVESGKKIR